MREALLGVLVVVEFPSGVSSSKTSSLKISVAFPTAEMIFPRIRLDLAVDLAVVSFDSLSLKAKSSSSSDLFESFDSSTDVSLSSEYENANDKLQHRTLKKIFQQFRLTSTCVVDDFTSANVKMKTDENFMATRQISLLMLKPVDTTRY